MSTENPPKLSDAAICTLLVRAVCPRLYFNVTVLRAPQEITDEFFHAVCLTAASIETTWEHIDDVFCIALRTQRAQRGTWSEVVRTAQERLSREAAAALRG